MSRRNARIVAMQALFQFDMGQPLANDMSMEEVRETALMMAADSGKDGEPTKLSDADLQFARFLVNGVLDNQAKIDEIIAAVSKNWKLNRMASIDRSVLRMAVFELKLAPEESAAPVATVIDEAVRIAKGFGTEKSGQFVNGVLASVVEAKD
ncbi:MAG: transcription antitermination factor NusB [Selenomonadaceae bacterium]|nr:transcription antitermination factor NusB [Selenomonadaceae bacterium]